MSLHCNPISPFRRVAFRALFLGGLLVSLFPALVTAQSAGRGTIIGRVFNPATGEYLRNASVLVRETGQLVTAEDSGTYRIASVPSGTVTIEVSYTGFRSSVATVEVTAGATVKRDFELISSMQPTADEENGTIKLDRFVVVSGAREGSAKAIMDQRRSMNITNSVASDTFGDVAEGNVGEFLKHMPGVMLNLVEGEARTVSLRGLGPEYTSVTLDGVSLASADANSGAAGDARAFSFEQVSLSSMESIEVSKTVSADTDANAPAGTINLKPKRAFDREGRRITFQANATAFGRELTFSRTPGPDDNPSRKIRGGGIFEYSDVFFNKRLGLVLNVSESNVYSEISHTTVAYNEAATATDPRIAVPTQINSFHGPRTNRRSTVTINGDFKATDNLVLSLGYIYNDSDLWFFYRNQVFNTGGTRSAVAGTDPLLSFTSSSAGSVAVNPIAVAKVGSTHSFTPKFEYKRDNLLVEGRFVYSTSKSTYEPQARGAFRNLGSPTANGITFTAERSSVLSADWQIRQVAGPDIANGANFTSPTIETQDGRYDNVELFSGDVSASLTTNPLGIPVVWKAGVKKSSYIREFELTRDADRYNYTGPGAGLGAWAAYRTPFNYDLGAVGGSVLSSSGGNIFYPNLLATTALYFEHPEYFTRTLTAANYYNAYIANKKHYEEDIDAAFLMGTATKGKMTLRGGLRWEQTTGDSREFDPRTTAELQAAGFAYAAGRATTIEGLEYQYFSNPMVNRVGRYDHFFPSASLKYRFSPNLDFHFGYSSTIRRPTFRDIAGVWTINDESATVSAPNPNLKPETSDNFSMRAAYYFEPVGIFAVNFFQNNVQGLHRTTTLTAEEFGYDGPVDLSGYLFSTTVASAEEVEVRGMELEYSQSLSFLPGPFRGFNVRASYTRNYADVVITNMAPHSAAAGIGYSLYRASVYTNVNWQDDRPTNLTDTRYIRRRYNVDIGGSYRLSDRFSLFLNVRNVLDEPYIDMQKLSDRGSVARKYEIFGTNYTLGIKGVF